MMEEVEDIGPRRCPRNEIRRITGVGGIAQRVKLGVRRRRKRKLKTTYEEWREAYDKEYGSIWDSFRIKLKPDHSGSWWSGRHC